MVKITINWEVVSPFLQYIHGTLIIEDFNIDSYSAKKVFTCTIDVTNNPPCISYKSAKGTNFLDKKFSKYKNKINTMVGSYFNGVLLEKKDFIWSEE